jgi:hypothetical protein
MEVTTSPKYGINPPPTEEELKKAKELVSKAKAKARLNPPKNSQEAWANLDQAIKEIRDDFMSKNG